MTDAPGLNTDRELWRRDGNDPSDPDNYYQPSIRVTEKGLIAITVGGTVHVRSIEEWMKCSESSRDALAEEIDKTL